MNAVAGLPQSLFRRSRRDLNGALEELILTRTRAGECAMDEHGRPNADAMMWRAIPFPNL